MRVLWLFLKPRAVTDRSDPRRTFSMSPHMFDVVIRVSKIINVSSSNPTHREHKPTSFSPLICKWPEPACERHMEQKGVAFQCVHFSACVALAKRTRLRARQSSQPSRQQSAIQTGPHSWPAFPALPLSRSRPGRRSWRRSLSAAPAEEGGGGENGPGLWCETPLVLWALEKLWKALSYPLAWVPRSL